LAQPQRPVQIITWYGARIGTFGGTTFSELCKAHWPQLETLDLSGNDLSNDGLSKPAQADWPLLSSPKLSCVYRQSG